ncbi:GNAT family N-acetyltransferase [bacterium]|nr:GNAT family N-acetyltransferase [bacterium]
MNSTRTSYRSYVTPGDIASVQRLVSATGFFSVDERDIASELVADRLTQGPTCGYEFLFADGDIGLDGYACYGLIPCTAASYDLYWIAVDPGSQGTGLGRRLLEETERRIRVLGGTAIYAETSGRAQYASTRAFYEKCGYAIGAVFPDFYAAGDDKVVFVKRLGGELRT